MLDMAPFTSFRVTRRINRPADHSIIRAMSPTMASF